MARLHEARGSPVEDDVTRSAFHRVGLEARAIVDVQHRDLLELTDVGEHHELAAQRDGADVVEVRAGDGGAVDLRLHHHAVHARLPRSADASVPCTESVTLSMRRVFPTRAATASSTSPSRVVRRVSSCASRASTYSRLTSGSVATRCSTAAMIVPASRSPASTAPAAVSSARDSTTAAPRCPGGRDAV